MNKKVIITDKAPEAIGAYSQAVKAGNLIFISGQIAFIYALTPAIKPPPPTAMYMASGGV